MQISLTDPPVPPHHVIVTFGPGIGSDAQGRALLRLERYLREELGVPAEVFKVTMQDDLKRRRDMTVEQRASL